MSMRIFRFTFLLFACLAFAGLAALISTSSAQHTPTASAAAPNGGPTRLLRTPTVSATQIAFAYAQNIWTVQRQGGGHLVAPVISVGVGIAVGVQAGVQEEQVHPLEPQGRVENNFDVLPLLGYHDRAFLISRCSHALATFKSRLTVAGDTPTDWAVCSIVSPPKKRSSTIRLC